MKILLPVILCLCLLLNGFNSAKAQQIQAPISDSTWQDLMQDPKSNFYEVQAKFREEWATKAVTKGKGYKAFKRWEWFMEPRVFADGSWPPADAVYQAMQAQPEMFATNQNMPGNWSYIGNTAVPTGGGAGRINSVRELPGSTSTFFACSPGGGLWKTTNSGTSWAVLGTDFLTSIGASDIAIDPGNTNIMYLATGDGDASDTYSLGVLKSTDGGNTWNTTGLNWNVTQTRITNRIILNPTNTQILLCATSDGIYRTTDGGTAWSQVVTGNFKDLKFKPGDPSVVYACTNQFYKSINGGLTWSVITSALPSSASTSRMAVAVSANNPAYVYVLAGDNAYGLQGIYRSVDSGTNFLQQADNAPNYLDWSTTGGAAGSGGQAWYDLRIDADPTNAETIFIGGVNVWKSIDGGTNYTLAGHWTGNSAPYVHADIHAIYFVPGTTRLLVGCDGGVFTTTNGGPNFSDISSNLAIAQQYRLSVAGTNSNIVITGWQDNGTNLKNNAVHSEVIGGDGMDCQINPSNSAIMYGELYYGSIYKSTNTGGSFSNIVGSGGSNEDEDGAWITPFVLGPNPAHIFVGKSKVFKSIDSGTTFTASAAFGGTGDCNDIAVAPSNANIVYASKGNALFKSIDNAATFVPVAGMQGSNIQDIAIHNTDPNKVWVSYSNYTAGAKIYYTSNGGTSWTNISGSLPNLPANALVYQPGTSNGIYVGMDAGVFYRDDVLGNFVPYMNLLPNVEITDLDINTGTSTITVATYGRGIWRAPLYSLPNLDAVVNGVIAPSGTYCSTSISPQVNILNAGTTPIISMTIQYQVVGQTLQTYNWTGNITTGNSTLVTLPTFNYGSGPFTFNVNITAVNTLTDDNTANNTGTSVYYAIAALNNATLTLDTDCYPTETNWTITDTGGNIVHSGSGYPSENINVIPLCLPDGCFTFNIYDSYGDGISGSGCGGGAGSYSITDNATGTTIVTMVTASFNFAASHNFCYPLTPVSGCTNSTACNYNPLATINNGTCTFGPTNDLCAGAQLLVVNAAQTATTNVGTCGEAANPTCGGSTQMKDVWFKFVYAGGPVTISTNFTGFTLTDTRLALYSLCGGGNQLACNDDISGSNFRSSITIACNILTLGTTYYIQAGGYNATTGTFAIQVTAPIEICNAIDDDCDGSVDEGFDNDNDGYTTCAGDCNDSNAAIHPNAVEICNGVDEDCDGSVDEGVLLTFYRDQDGDGFGNVSIVSLACSAPVGYVSNSADCNDSAATIFPGATETCNGLDDDCDGSVDEGLLTTFFRDQDADGFGNIAITANACSAPVGYVTNSSDCNDNNNAIRPGAMEVCNGVDDDCDGSIDEGVLTTFYRDQDNDGFGNISITTQACSAPVGYVSNSTDCNDVNAAIRPGAAELCNGVDDNCNGSVDEGVLNTYYRDQDGDGYGNSSITAQACSVPAGFVINSTDCNDANILIHPGATEVCNALDDDCDGSTDEGVLITYYRDQDLDGFGNNAITTLACSVPVGYVTNNSDCNDSNLAIHPGATEICNGLDDDCDALIDEGGTATFYQDSDGDGFGNVSVVSLGCNAPIGYVSNYADCNDTNASIYPGATEVCNGVDDNCDGSVDNGFDNDNDGFTICEGDCNDSNATIFPGAPEACNGADDNCDGSIDNGVTFQNYYTDTDGDGYGNALLGNFCSAPANSSLNNLDCNDANASINPNEIEICNGLDDDCDGTTDEGFDQDADGYTTCGGDCNDNNNNIHPGATEICNGADDNCNASIDEGLLITYYRDADNDGFGNAAITTIACSPPVGYVVSSTDCNDTNSGIYPGALEICNGFDDNCNGSTDEGFDTDADGFSTCNGDCNDGNANIHPGAIESCNAIDDDCDGLTDEGFDNDNDGYSICAGDCNDNNGAIHPGALESCNGADDNCDGSIDNGVVFVNYYNDIDGDGYGNGLIGNLCTAPPSASLNNTDCNDNNPNIHPGAIEMCNGIDDNCDGTVDNGFDNDGDGFTTCAGDCNDLVASIHPGAIELCNGLDDDCDGSIDEGLALLTWYIDADNDGYGSAVAGFISACTQPVGYVSNNTDCNDGIASVHPNAGEICGNGIDEDCDSFIDEGCSGSTPPNDNMSTAQNVSMSNNVYPYCSAQTGTCLGATPSLQGNPANVITGEDVWFKFTAVSPGVRIVFNTSQFNGVLELHNSAGTQLDAENITGMGGTEMLNFSGLSEGLQYFVAVRNYNSALGNGGFTLCVQALMDSNCDYGPGTFSICNNFKADWTGANAYNFNFTPSAGGLSSSATSTGIIPLSNTVLGLQIGQSYNNTIDAVYYLSNGAGTMETIVVLGNENCLITIAPHQDVQVKAFQRCPATVTKFDYLRGAPNVCGAIYYQFEFTEITSLGVPVGNVFTGNNASSAILLSLAFNIPQSLTPGSYYNVRIRPVFPYGAGVYGTPQCIHFVSNPEIVAIEPLDSVYVGSTNGLALVVYPNPNEGGQFLVNLGNYEAQSIHLAILDEVGRTVHAGNYTRQGQSNITITLPRPLSDGLYLLHFTVNGEQVLRRLVVAH